MEGDNEVSVGIYSPSACGLYGFTNVCGTRDGIWLRAFDVVAGLDAHIA